VKLPAASVHKKGKTGSALESQTPVAWVKAAVQVFVTKNENIDRAV
jgi:hypothetical protein